MRLLSENSKEKYSKNPSLVSPEIRFSTDIISPAKEHSPKAKKLHDLILATLFILLVTSAHILEDNWASGHSVVFIKISFIFVSTLINTVYIYFWCKKYIFKTAPF